MWVKVSPNEVQHIHHNYKMLLTTALAILVIATFCQMEQQIFKSFWNIITTTQSTTLKEVC
jgi:hypothetical protein